MRVTLLFAAFLAACDTTLPTPPPELDGVWVGTVTTDISQETWRYTLSDNDGVVSGGLEVTIGQYGLLGAVAGTYDHPTAQISSDLTWQNVTINCVYIAAVSDSRESMNGVCDCNDGVNVIVSASLLVRKQPS